MLAVSHRKIMTRLLITLTLLACWSASDSTACCGWTYTEVCANSTDSKGAFCDEAECLCGPPFDVTSTSYTMRCAHPGWGCPSAAIYCTCLLSLYTDQHWTYVDTVTQQPCPYVCADGQTQACVTSDGCEGTQTCACNKWGECKKTCPCCPPSCDQCGQGGT